MARKLSFSSDYMEGCAPEILQRMSDTNRDQTAGYGIDPVTEAAREKIRAACACPGADVYFLVGGTQTNVTVIDALLSSYQGVVAADTGHIAVHEAGAIEFGGHKVLTLPPTDGKISAAQVSSLLDRFYRDGNWEHMVMPGMVYISQPTELGTLYSLKELTELSAVCRKAGIPLYVDGARMAYALGCQENDVTLPDLAKLCDVFYIGGTKCGALFGEAVVIPKKGFIPHFFTIIKQHGALLAKGWLLGRQFDTLFTDDLYLKLGRNAIDAAHRVRAMLEQYGYRQVYVSPTNQVFVLLENSLLKKLEEKVTLGFWENADADHTVMRIATCWATTQQELDELETILKEAAE